MQPNQQNPYDFILDSNQQKGPSGPNFAGGNKTMQYVIFGVFVLIVITAALVIFSIITSSGKDSANDLISVRAYQQELSRVIELGDSDITDPSLRNQITTLKTSVLTDTSEVSNAISSLGTKINEEDLLLQYNSDIEEELATAKSQGRINEKFSEIVKDLASEYFNSLNTASISSTSETSKLAIDTAKTNVQIIYKSENTN